MIDEAAFIWQIERPVSISTVPAERARGYFL
jgi:hypothetical protein